MFGKKLRLGRLFSGPSGNSLMVALDHGLTMGPIRGLADPLAVMRALPQRLCPIFILHKGQLERAAQDPGLFDRRFILHCSAATNLSGDSGRKTLVAGVEEGIRLGADGISVHISLGHPEELAMLSDLGRIAEACGRWGMPLLTMLYFHKNLRDASALAHGARVCQELGADLVKLPLPQRPSELGEICRAVSIPVLVAGGETAQLPEFLAAVEQALGNGARGAVVGRNIFQADHPGEVAKSLRELINLKRNQPKGEPRARKQSLMV